MKPSLSDDYYVIRMRDSQPRTFWVAYNSSGTLDRKSVIVGNFYWTSYPGAMYNFPTLDDAMDVFTYIAHTAPRWYREHSDRLMIVDKHGSMVISGCLL